MQKTSKNVQISSNWPESKHLILHRWLPAGSPLIHCSSKTITTSFEPQVSIASSKSFLPELLTYWLQIEVPKIPSFASVNFLEWLTELRKMHLPV
jgi:hypothetical protein